MPDDGSQKVFFNSASISQEALKSLTVGQPVEYKLTEMAGGARAIDIKTLKPGGGAS